MTAYVVADRMRSVFGFHSRLVRAAIVLGSGLVVGKQMGVFANMTPGDVLSLVPVTFVLYWFSKSPRWPLAAFVFATLFGLYRNTGLGLGPVNLRMPDFPYLFLLGWAILLRAREGRGDHRPVGQQYVALFLAVLGLSLFPVLIVDFGTAVDGLVGWLRFVQTLSLIWIVPYLLRTPEDRLWFLQMLLLAIVAEQLYAVYLYSIGTTYGRLSGHNGPNAQGLLAAVLVVLALHSPVPRRPEARLFCLVLGLICLAMARSIGSTVALGLVLGVYGVRAAARHFDLKKDALVRPVRLLLLLTAVFAVVSTLRPNDLPGAEGFNFSSAAYRIVVGYAGVQIWADHPILGVGWQQSSQPDIISDPELIEMLQERFTDVNPSFFPTTQGATVHNAYLQVLAEAGTIGAMVLVLAAFAIKRNVRLLLAGLSGSERVTALSAALILVVVLIWWNDNPFFGTQPETVLAAAMLGFLASYRYAGGSRRPAQAGGAPLRTARGVNGRAAAPSNV